MQISSAAGNSLTRAVSAQPRPEQAERGPDHDNDGDEGAKVAATAKSLPTPSAGRGGKVDMLA